MVVKKKETAISEVGLPVAKHRTNCTTSSGLGVKITRVGAGLASHSYCHNVLSRARIAVLGRVTKGRGRSLLVSTRRSIAASCFARGVSFGGSSNHGIIAPSYFMGAIRSQFLTGGRAGGLMADRFLVRGNSYPVRPALPVGKGEQIKKSVLGKRVMMRTLTRNVSTVFPSIPEPIYHPVTSSTGNASNNDVKTGGSFDAPNTLSCSATASRAMLSASVRKNGCGRGNPLGSVRRSIAASCFVRGVSFGGSCNHGVIASAIKGAVYPQFLMGSRAGGFLACRHLTRGISTPHGLPSPWKGSAVLRPVLGIFAMMRTLTRSVSTTFISTPEPVFKPVTSATAGSREPVSYDVTSDVNAIVELLANEYNSTINDSSVYGRFRFNVLRGVAVEVLRACDETLGRVYTPSKVIGG